MRKLRFSDEKIEHAMQNMQHATGQWGGAVKGDDILDRMLKFAARVGNVVDSLPETRLGKHIASQLVRSGTSPAPNYAEGRAAESRDDFCHKLGVALKELRESHVWLLLITEAKMLPGQRLHAVTDECDQLARILARSILTARQKRPRK